MDPNNASTLDTINNLGLLYVDQGKLVEAEKMYERALEGYEKAWGSDHTTLVTANNLGSLYAKHGKLEDAETMYQRTLRGYENVFKPHDMLTFVPALHSTYSYGALLERLGRQIDAKLMYTKALRGYEEVFGTRYRWYLAAHEHLRNLEGYPDSHSASPMIISRRANQITDTLPSTELSDVQNSKRYRLLGKFGPR